MKKFLYVLSLSCLPGMIFLSSAETQAQCGGRYVWETFSDFASTPDIQYGSNIDYEGNPIDLHVDFYEPAGDTMAERPLVILAHGGFFISGDRTAGDIVGICQSLARRGYACASLQYRLGVGLTELDSAGFAKAVIRGVQDAKAAVRFFRAEAETYGIDTTQIFLGGTSAGGVLAVHYAYLQDTALLPGWINVLIEDLGGLEGESGNPGYNALIKAAVSYAGAIKHIDWMGPRAVPLASTHGTADDVVPYGYGWVTYVVVPGLIELPITPMYGSSEIHPVLTSRSVNNDFRSYEGAGHVPHISSSGLDPVIFPETIQFTTEFLHRQLECYDPLASHTPVRPPLELHAWPVPALDQIQVEGLPNQDQLLCRILDLQGRTLRQWSAVSNGLMTIGRDGLASGNYWFTAESTNGERFVASLQYR